jgi:hypothetical protein
MWTDSGVPDQHLPSDSDQLDDEEPCPIPDVAKPPPDCHQNSTATRHLCAGVYLDPAFRDLVLRKVHNDTRHRVAPSAGFDLVSVVWHAWRARFLQDVTYVALLAVLVAAILSGIPAALVTLCLIGLWYLVPRAFRLAPGVLRHLFSAAGDELMHRHEPRGNPAQLREQAQWLAFTAGGCALFGAVAVLVAEWQGTPLVTLAVPAAGWAALAGVLAAGSAALRQAALNSVNTAEALRPASLSRRLQVIHQQQIHQFVVYRRPKPVKKDKKPDRLTQPDPPELFVGSGVVIHRFAPVAVDLLKPGSGTVAERKHLTQPFCTTKLVNHLVHSLAELAEGPGLIRLPFLEVEHRVFVAEADVARTREWLQPWPNEPDLHEFIDNPHTPAQHFLEIRVGTDDELVTTVFAQVTMQGRSLTLHVAGCALTRTPADYHITDGHAAGGTSAILRSALRGLRDMPAEVVGSWRLILVPFLYLGAARAMRPDHTLVPRRRHDIAARLSVREEKAVPWEDAGPDHPRIVGHMTILEQRLFAATEDFLVDHNVDISAFSKSAETIISANVVTMPGGQTHIDGSAVGNAAQVNNNQPGGGQPRGGKA